MKLCLFLAHTLARFGPCSSWRRRFERSRTHSLITHSLRQRANAPSHTHTRTHTHTHTHTHTAHCVCVVLLLVVCESAVRLSVCLSVCPRGLRVCVCLSVCLSVCLVYLSVCRTVGLSDSLSPYSSMYLRPPFCLYFCTGQAGRHTTLVLPACFAFLCSTYMLARGVAWCVGGHGNVRPFVRKPTDCLLCLFGVTHSVIRPAASLLLSPLFLPPVRCVGVACRSSVLSQRNAMTGRKTGQHATAAGRIAVFYFDFFIVVCCWDRSTLFDLSRPPS